MLGPVLLALAAAGPARLPAVRAQGTGDEVPGVLALLREHMKTLRDPRRSALEKVPAMEALLGLELQGPYALSVHATREAAELDRRFVKEREALLKDFRRLAPRVVAGRLDRKASREVEELRGRSLSATRDRGLTKETVVAVCDPAIRRLEELLSVTLEDVLDADPDFDADWWELLELVDDAGVWFDYRARALAVLDASEEGKRLARRVAEVAAPAEREAALRGALELESRLAVPISERDREVLAANAERAPELDPEEARGIARLNELRAYLGLRVLAVDVKLCAAGRDHSKDMHELGFFSHTSPVEGKESVGRRAANFGTSASAENIAGGQSTGRGAIEAWWHSPGHHRNMLGGQGRVGLGRHAELWTQMLGG